MAKTTYKNTGENEITIPNVGAVAPGDTITCPEPVNHPDLEHVKQAKTKAEDTK